MGMPRIEPVAAGWEAWTLPLSYFVPPHAATKIRTHISKVALTRELLKDALPSELPRRTLNKDYHQLLFQVSSSSNLMFAMSNQEPNIFCSWHCQTTFLPGRNKKRVGGSINEIDKVGGLPLILESSQVFFLFLWFLLPSQSNVAEKKGRNQCIVTFWDDGDALILDNYDVVVLQKIKKAL